MSYLIDDIRCYWRQFRPPRALACTVQRALARVTDPCGTLSYSQFGEDRLLACLMDARKPGRFVEVGANHPTKLSNTYALYKLGWCGVTIDGNPTLVALHRRIRPKDIAIEAIISDKSGPLIFRECANHAFSSVEGLGAPTLEFSRAYPVAPRTLISVLDELNFPQNFELLAVDVEGHDENVLRSLDWNVYKPKVVLVEMHGLDLSSPQRPSLADFLLQRGYQFAAYDGVNGFFLKR